MTTDIVTRLVIALAIAAAGLAVYWLANRVLLARVQKNRVPGARPGVPAVLYFTTPDCAPCRTIQRPALRCVQEQLGERVQIIEIDATLQPELAARWGVLSVPTTFVIDGQGRTRSVNHGVARAEKLLLQVGELAAARN